MNKEIKEMVDTLKRLQFQVQGAIVLMENGCVKPDPKYAASRTAPNTFIVGDFVIRNRFVEPTA